MIFQPAGLNFFPNEGIILSIDLGKQFRHGSEGIHAQKSKNGRSFAKPPDSKTLNSYEKISGRTPRSRASGASQTTSRMFGLPASLPGVRPTKFFYGIEGVLTSSRRKVMTRTI